MVSLDLEHGYGDSELYLFKRAGAEGRVCDLPRRARRFARIMRAHLGGWLVDGSVMLVDAEVSVLVVRETHPDACYTNSSSAPKARWEQPREPWRTQVAVGDLNSCQLCCGSAGGPVYHGTDSEESRDHCWVGEVE